MKKNTILKTITAVSYFIMILSACAAENNFIFALVGTIICGSWLILFSIANK